MLSMTEEDDEAYGPLPTLPGTPCPEPTLRRVSRSDMDEGVCNCRDDELE